MKEKIVVLFSETQASQVLNKNELESICEFLSSKIPLFKAPQMKRDALNAFISASEVVEIKSDSLPFSHNIER
jgi:hypothetical protein